jgi:hypothetical protein
MDYSSTYVASHPNRYNSSFLVYVIPAPLRALAWLWLQGDSFTYATVHSYEAHKTAVLQRR